MSGVEGQPTGRMPGFRVFAVGRETASRFRVRAPWRARPGAGLFERALVGTLAFLIALPISIVLLALGLVALVVFLGCASVFVVFALAMWVVRRIFGVPRRGFSLRRSEPVEDARENVRVVRRQDPFA